MISTMRIFIANMGRKRKLEAPLLRSLLPTVSTICVGSKSDIRRFNTAVLASISTTHPGLIDSLSGSCPPQVNQKLWNKFYESLVLLSAYGKSQGGHVGFEREVPDGDKSLKKRFLDQLAYICDYLPGGNAVAAIAIQSGPILIYWIAANTNKGSKTKPFLSSILHLLENVYNASDGEALTLQHQIADRAMVFSSKKLVYYRSKLKRTIKSCLNSLNAQGTKEASDLKEWLSSLHNSNLDLPSFGRLCYEARNSKMLEVVKQRAEEYGVQRDDASSYAKYARIQHLIGCMGSYITATQILVDTGRQYPQLFTDYSIEIATCHPSFTPPAYMSKSSINGIIGRMVKSLHLCEYYQRELQFDDKNFHLMLEKRIRDEYRNHHFKLKVHAEVIILDLFHRKGFQFLDGVRYIGVSKPSCFLCYRYIQAHPLQAQTSGSSNSLYIQWQPPYIQENSPSLVKEQEDILNTMIEGIQRSVVDAIMPDYQRLKGHPDPR